MAPRRRDFGELSPRLLKLSVETNKREPYSVTDKLVVHPPTKARAEALREAHQSISRNGALLQIALRRATEERPEPPEADANDDAVAEWQAAVAEWEQSTAAAEAQLSELSDAVEAATEQYNRAFFGDAYDDVQAASADWEPELWQAFVDDIREHFLGAVNPPPDGTDDNGQIVDAEEAGKAP